MVERTGDAWAMAVKLDGGVVVEYESWEYEGRRRKIQRRRALDGVTIGFAGGEIVGIEGGLTGLESRRCFERCAEYTFPSPARCWFTGKA